MRWPILVILVILVILGARIGSADPGLDQDHVLDRDPDPATPVFELSWREGLRAKAGTKLPLARRDDRLGLSVEVPGFIELHNDGPGIVPYEMWRGHIGLAVADRWLDGRWTLRVSAALEHESDHDIMTHWIYWEGATLGLAATRDDPRLRLTLIGQARLLFETCTSSFACTDGAGRGDTSIQGTASVIAELSPHRPRHAFVALYSDATAHHGEVARELRAIAHVGYTFETAQRGAWQLFAVVLAGPEVGLDRLLGNQLRYGVGMRWQAR